MRHPVSRSADLGCRATSDRSSSASTSGRRRLPFDLIGDRAIRLVLCLWFRGLLGSRGDVKAHAMDAGGDHEAGNLRGRAPRGASSCSRHHWTCSVVIPAAPWTLESATATTVSTRQARTTSTSPTPALAVTTRRRVDSAETERPAFVPSLRFPNTVTLPAPVWASTMTAASRGTRTTT